MTPRERGPDRSSGPKRHLQRDRHTPRPARKTATREYEAVHLDDDIVSELKATVRPGKGEILVKVFADAAAAFAAGDLERAIELGEQAKHMALRSPVIREFLGLAYYQHGDYQNAATELSTFRRISGTTAQNPVIADCYRALGKPEKAIELCDEIDPRITPAAVYYEGTIVAASALADMGRVDEGIARIERLELAPAAAEEHHLCAWYVLGDLLERRGRFTQALEWFEALEAADAGLTDAGDRARRLRKI